MEYLDGLRAVKSICFELSNICNYSIAHRKCPLHNVKGKNTLPTQIITKTIEELGEINYSGSIAFHNYNEPLIDPRLFYLSRYAKNICKNSIVRLTTNGYYLTQNLADELKSHGIDDVTISLYSESEAERLKNIRFSDIVPSFYAHGLDDRENIYTGPQIPCCLPCYSLSTEVIVRHTADVALCCLDWDSRYTFGNLGTSSLQDILTSSTVREVQNDLQQGQRTLEICKRCDWQRGI